MLTFLSFSKFFAQKVAAGLFRSIVSLNFGELFCPFYILTKEKKMVGTGCDISFSSL